jgi:UDP-glucose 4-epimerase
VNTYFVTGATGFVGNRLIKKLREGSKKTDIKILSRKQLSDYGAIVCDLQNDEIPQDALENMDTVFHIAGITHDMSNASKVKHLYHAVNVVATVKLAELAVCSAVKHFVFVSSVKAGGVGEDNVETKPEGVYGRTKREAEIKLLDIGRKSGMHVSIVRPSLVYGAGAKGNLALMRKGIEQGWFPPLPETGNRRSMIHVDDLVEALLIVAEDERANGEIFIATDGVPKSSRKIYEAICHSVGKEVPKWSVPKFLFDGLSLVSPRIRYKVDKLLGDEYYSSEKLEELGFRAEKSLLDFDR